MSFTAALWTAMTPIYGAILRHPFLAGLTDGSLPRERFRFYVVQDALYLREFARALSLAAARAPEDRLHVGKVVAPPAPHSRGRSGKESRRHRPVPPSLRARVLQIRRDPISVPA